MRARKWRASETERLNAGDLDLDRETLRVRRASGDIHLGPTEFRLLECLLEKPGRVYSRAQLLMAYGAVALTSMTARSTCISDGCARRSD
jgi:DNA-binding response OmpR family regulator